MPEIMQLDGVPALSATADYPQSTPTEPSVTAPSSEEVVVEDKTPPESEPEQVTETSSATEPKPARGVQKALDRLTRERTEADARTAEALVREAAANERLDKILKALERQEPVTKSGPPNMEDFQTNSEYEAASLEYQVNKAVESRVAKLEEARKEENVRARAKEAMDVAVATFAERKAAANIPDFDEIVTDEVKINGAVGIELLTSELGPQLAYHIATHDDVRVKLNGLQGARLAKEIGRLEAKLQSTPVIPVTKVPPPIEASQGTGHTNAPDFERMSMADYVSSRNAAERAAADR